MRSLLAMVVSVVLVSSSLAQAQPVPVPPPDPVPPADVLPPPPPQSISTEGLSFDQVVTLRDGTALRCAAFERVPDQHLRIVLPTGEVRTIAWGDIANVRPYRSLPAPAAPTAPSGELPPVLRGVVVPRGERRGRRVSISAEDRDTLMVGLRYGRDGFEPLCTLPCTLHLESGTHPLTFTGPGIREYAAVVDTRFGDLRVVANTPTRGAFAAGLTLTLVGVALAITGLVLLGSGISTSDTIDALCRSGDSCDTGGDDMVAYGAVLAIVGVIGSVGGTAMLVGNRSGVEITPR